MLKPRKHIGKRELKEDKLVTFAFRAQSYFFLNMKRILLIGGGGVVVVVLLSMMMISKQRSNAIASASLTQAEIMFRAGNTEAARQVLLSMVDTYKGTPSAGQGVHLLGNVLFDSREYDESITYFQRYLDDYGDNPLIQASAKAGVASCYEEQGKNTEAAAMFRRAADEYPSNHQAPEFLLNAARCYEAAADVENARKSVQDLLDRYPDTPYADEAELTLARLLRVPVHGLWGPWY